MLEKTARPRRPTRLTRVLARFPILLYRLGLGFLLGERFLLLIHKGRRSGRLRKAVLEVMQRDEPTGTYYVASGWGERSEWYRNVVETPQVEIQVGPKKLEARAERTSRETAEEVLVDYGRRHPKTLQRLARVMGFRIDAREEDYRALAREVPVIGFHTLQ